MKNLYIVFLLLCSFSPAIGQNQLELDATNHENGLALQGFDSVSYFNGKPKKGSSESSVLHEGVTYLFENTENLKKFSTNPDKYVPRYGGWCAYAIGAKGELVNVNPETYKIIDGKLYLFYNAYFNNTLKKWNMNEEELLKSANQNWDNLFKK